MAQKKPVVENGSNFETISETETLGVQFIPISADAGNIIQARSGGLFARVCLESGREVPEGFFDPLLTDSGYDVTQVLTGLSEVSLVRPNGSQYDVIKLLDSNLRLDPTSVSAGDILIANPRFFATFMSSGMLNISALSSAVVESDAVKQGAATYVVADANAAPGAVGRFKFTRQAAGNEVVWPNMATSFIYNVNSNLVEGFTYLNGAGNSVSVGVTS